MRGNVHFVDDMRMNSPKQFCRIRSFSLVYFFIHKRIIEGCAVTATGTRFRLCSQDLITVVFIFAVFLCVLVSQSVCGVMPVQVSVLISDTFYPVAVTVSPLPLLNRFRRRREGSPP
jgi:hypothetical protein